MSDIIYRKISEANRTYSLFAAEDKILVALSGGADSVALLLSLKEYFPANKLYACHVNHMLRGDEAERDCRFAVELCEKAGIPIDVLKTDVAEYAKSTGMSTELAARKIRYDFFEKVCKKHGIGLVATAHTLSDNAETVLFNLTRGSALAGLCGIPPRRSLTNDIFLIRPLIFVSRSEVEAYLDKRNQSYVTDSSNLTDDYTRNYFRHNIIPVLKKVNPSLEENIGNTCKVLRDTQIFIDKTANNNLTDDIFALSRLPECILSQTILLLYRQKTGNTLIENIHINEIASIIKTAAEEKVQKKREVCLPDKISAIIDKGRISFVPTVRASKAEKTGTYSQPLHIGENVIGNTGFTVFVADDDAVPVTSEVLMLYDSTSLDASLIDGNLTARSRITGDTVRTCGMTKKVKELFIHKKIPAGERNVLPIICDETDILFIPKTAVCDKHRKAAFSGNNKLRIFIYYSGPHCNSSLNKEII